MAKILISGGTGTIGSRLSELLAGAGHDALVLSRKKKAGRVYWDPAKGEIDLDALRSVDHLVNLAGAGVMDKRWTRSYKQEILNSRLNAVSFLHSSFLKTGRMPLTVCGASAVGFYGMATREMAAMESDEAGSDFLASVCVQWEKSYEAFADSGSRLCITRIGIVLSASGGAYPPLASLCAKGLGSAAGSGKQAFPWIHADDVCGIFMHQLFNPNLCGIFNAVAPEQIDNSRFMHLLADSFGKKIYLPPVPSVVMKLALGERAVALTGGTAVSAEKVLESDYRFKYNDVKKALAQLAASYVK